MNLVKTPQDYVALLRRRKILFASIMIVVLAMSVVVALYLPPVFRSTAMILIEAPEVPPDLVQSTVTSYADQRIQLIKYRVITTQNLTQIMNRFGLYRVMRRDTPLTEVMEQFREDIGVETISAQVLNPQSGRPSKATIAFTVSYDSPEPEVAQKVANELVTLYLSENARERQGQAIATTEFLGQEAERLAVRIRDLESALEKFKQTNAGNLPQQLDANLSIMDRAERDLSDVNRRMEGLKERQGFLESELVMLNGRLSNESQGASAGSGFERLAALRGEASRLRNTRGPNHPELLRLLDEIATLEGQGRPQGAPGTSARGQETITGSGGEGSTNPAVLQLRSQLNAVNSELAALGTQRRALTSRIKTYEDRVLSTPTVEREYLTLIRDYDNAQKKYNETKDKQLGAEFAQSLEMERKSERFVLIEPPQLPAEPSTPSKPTIVGIGFALAVAAGIGMVLLVDIFDSRIYGARQLASFVGEMPLVVVPYIRTPKEQRRQMVTRAFSAAGVLLVVAAGAAGVHYQIMPLDLLWLKILGAGAHLIELPGAEMSPLRFLQNLAQK